MSLKDPVWMLIVVVILAVLTIYGYIPSELVLISFVAYVFLMGLTIEMEEIKLRDSVRSIFNEKIERIEKSIYNACQRIESEERIKRRLSAKRKEVIEWLCKF
ncbi:MAG: hypothetical protein V1850_02310 [Candidatus Bathyarchaeota archaeon]